MRQVLLAACLAASTPGFARADEATPPIGSERPTAQTSALVPPPSPSEADDEWRSGRRRLAGGIALLVVGVIGWGVSTAGTVVSIVGYVKDARNQCSNGACDTLKTTGTWLGVGGGIADAGGLGAGIPLVVSGVHRLREARRLRVGLAATTTGAGVSVAGGF